jgi:hypothetical protein
VNTGLRGGTLPQTAGLRADLVDGAGPGPSRDRRLPESIALLESAYEDYIQELSENFQEALLAQR